MGGVDRVGKGLDWVSRAWTVKTVAEAILGSAAVMSLLGATIEQVQHLALVWKLALALAIGVVFVYLAAAIHRLFEKREIGSKPQSAAASIRAHNMTGSPTYTAGRDIIMPIATTPESKPPTPAPARGRSPMSPGVPPQNFVRFAWEGFIWEIRDDITRIYRLADTPVYSILKEYILGPLCSECMNRVVQDVYGSTGHLYYRIENPCTKCRHSVGRPGRTESGYHDLIRSTYLEVQRLLRTDTFPGGKLRGDIP
jgi:hypothetical protein